MGTVHHLPTAHLLESLAKAAELAGGRVQRQGENSVSIRFLPGCPGEIGEVNLTLDQADGMHPPTFRYNTGGIGSSILSLKQVYHQLCQERDMAGNTYTLAFRVLSALTTQLHPLATCTWADIRNADTTNLTTFRRKKVA